MIPINMFEDFNTRSISLAKYVNAFFKILWLIFACATIYMLATIYIGWQKFSSTLYKFDTTTDITGIDIGKFSYLFWIVYIPKTILLA